MTIAQQQLAFKLVYDSVDTQGYPGFEPEEIDFFLNRSIERFVKQRYAGHNVHKSSFEETQKRIEDLRTIVVRNLTTATTVIPSTLPNVNFEYTLPNGIGVDKKYYILISSTVSIDKDECGQSTTNRVIKVKQVTHDALEEWLDDPYHNPDYNECLILFEGNKVLFYTGGLYNVTRFDMVYLTFPDQVNILSAPPVDCNLPEHTHQEIVDIAVKLARGAVEDQTGLQIEGSLSNETE